MNVSEMYPSAYLRAADIARGGQTLVIQRLLNEKLGDEMKWVLYFQKEQRGLVLNKTNASAIEEKLGATDAWINKSVTLTVQKVSFQGKLVDGIRVMVPDFDDDIPL